jgi:TP901 family phage tail tape measure protein
MPSSLNATLNVQLNPQSLNASTRQIQQALGRITGQASEFQKSLDASTARVFAFGATTVVINGVTQSFKKLLSTTVDVQKRLVEINSIFKASESTFNRFRNSIFKVAQETGQSFNTVAEGAAELARQGLSAEETASRLKSALILTRISGLDAEKSVKALTAAINGFTSAGLTANTIVNKMVAVDTAFAVSTQDLAEAFSRAGSTAEDAGVSFNELLGLITAVEQRTARGGAVIGNAFKSIFTRLSRGTTLDSLKELGVEINATQTGVQKLMALSNAIEKIGDPTVVSKIKELAGGVFQINVVSAALKDLGSQTSVFSKAAVTAANATNDALEKNKQLNTTIASQMNALVQGITSLSEKIGSITFGPLMENLIGIASKLTGFLDEALDPEKGNVFIKGLFKAIGSFLSGPAVIIFTAAFLKIFKLVAKFAGEGMKALFSMGTQSQKIKDIEGGIVALLQRDENLRNQINSSTTTQAQKEQLIIDAIRRENTLLTEQATIMQRLATAAASRGVTGFGGGGFTGKRGRFSMGFRAEEAEARALGAPPDVRARLSDGTVMGQRVIMNNKEKEVRNYAGGKDSAIIPSYARGFVPNYAGVGSISAGANRFGTLRNIMRGGRSGAKGQFQRGIGGLSAEEANLALRRGRDGRVGAAPAQQFRNVMVVNPSTSGMLIPQIKAKTKVAPRTRGTYKGKGNKSVHFEYGAGLPVRGPQVPHAVDQAADPDDEHLKKNITKKVTEEARKFAALVHPVLGEPKRAAIESMLKSQGGGKGALKGIIGAAFEAAVNVGLDLSPAKSVEGGDFDVKKLETRKMNKIRTLFGLEKSSHRNLLDFKHDMTDGTIASFAKKLVNEKKFKIEKRPLRRSRKSMGFIPNYASGGGVPKSLMRIHEDDKGNKVLTNTRDEPNGVQDAIKRERKGIGMFASGFVPNYAASKDEMSGMKMMGLSSAIMALQGALMSVEASYEQEIMQSEALVEAKKNEIMGSSQEFGAKLSAIRTLNKENRERDKTVPVMVKLASAASTATNALMAMAALNMVTGGGMGRLGGKLLGGAGRGAGKLLGGVARMTGLAAVGRGAAGASRAIKGVGGRAVGGVRDMGTRFSQRQRSVSNMRAGLPKGGAVQYRQNLMNQGASARQASHLTRQKLASTASTRGVRSSAAMKGIRGVGRGGGLLGVALGGFEIASILKNDKLSDRQKVTGVSGVGGGMVGGLGGAKVGAMAGGAIGSVIPVVGTAVGAAVGGIIGGFAGWFAGKKGAEAIAEGIQGDPQQVVEEASANFVKGLGFQTGTGEGSVNAGYDSFAARVESETAKMKKAGVSETEIQARQQEFITAQDELTDAMNARAENEDEDKNEELAKAEEDAQKRLTNAAMAVANMRFSKAKNGLTAIQRQNKWDKEMGAVQRKLRAAQTELTKKINNRVSFEGALAEVSKGQFSAGMMESRKKRADGLAGLTATGPLAKGAELAAKQNAQFTHLNDLAAIEAKAAGEVNRARLTNLGVSKYGRGEQIDVEPLRKKLKAAGENFKKAAFAAGLNLRNEITRLNKEWGENQKALLKARTAAEAKFIDLVMGRKRGNEAGDAGIAKDVKALNKIAIAIAEVENRVKTRNLDAPTAKMYLDPMRENYRDQFQRTKGSLERGGYGDVDTQTAIKKISSEINPQTNALTHAVMKKISAQLDMQNVAKKGSLYDSAASGVGRVMRGQSGLLSQAGGGDPAEATKDLTKKQVELRAEMEAAKQAWIKFNKDPATKDIASSIRAYKEELDKAASKQGELTEFVGKNMNLATETATFIEKAKNFISGADENMELLVNQMEEMRTEIKGLQGEKD